MVVEQIIYTGIEQIQSILESALVKDVFLVTGNRSYELSGAKEQLETLLSDYNVTEFSDFEKNPKVEDLRRGIEKYRNSNSNIVLAVGGGSVLDMGKSIKILELAKRMVHLSGQQPILNSNGNLKDNEIAIIISGLRPGEKLFEELTYNSNLIGTIHPRINSAVEKSMKKEELKGLLSNIKDAIHYNNYQKLFENISKVNAGIPNITKSNDIFVKKYNIKYNEL